MGWGCRSPCTEPWAKLCLSSPGIALPAARLWLWLCEGVEGTIPCTMTSVLSSSIWAPLVAVHVYLPRSCWVTLWRVRILESSVCVCRDRRSGSITARCVCSRQQREGDERHKRDGAVRMGSSCLCFLLPSACLSLDRHLHH